MSGKYLLNSLHGTVNDHLTGLALSNDSVLLIDDVNAIVRKDYRQLSIEKKVFIISGGGAGHEPMFAGFVGQGRLSAAISGQFFASPSMGQIVKTVETICLKDDEILFIVANYTGDRLNFGLTKETLKQNGFKNISMFCFGDDISQGLFGDQTKMEMNLKHRRGLAGIDFLIRIAGQASEQGKRLSEIIEIVKNESAKICTISVSLTACEIPGVGESFHLEADQMELGLGIHGEPGIERVKIMTTKDTVAMMIRAILHYYEINSSPHSNDSPLSILVNNLGSMTQMELNVITKEIIQQLQSKSIPLRSIETRPVMTAFNMKGFSISSYSGSKINRLPEHKNNFDYCLRSKGQQFHENPDEIAILKRVIDQSMLIELLRSAARSLINNSEQLNCCDSAGGDSDCGTTMERLAQIVLQHIHESEYVTFSGLARTVSNSIGGTSGAIYGLFFFFAADFIVHHSSQSVGIKFWCELLKFATQKLSEYSGAQKNDRTMIDALWALENELENLSNAETELSNSEHLHGLKTKMILANERIAKLSPRAGRSANVDHERVKSQYDPGCFAVIVWCNAIIDCLLNTTKH